MNSYGMLKVFGVKDLEGLISGAKADDFCAGLGFSNNVSVEAVGASGGIWLLRNADVTDLQVVPGNQNIIHAKIQGPNVEFHFIIVYGPPTPARRVVFWHDLENFVANISDNLFVGGNFDCILNMDERLGDIINRLDLIDLACVGGKFIGDVGRLRRRRSRSALTASLLMSLVELEDAVVRHLPAIRSDHNPILLCLGPTHSFDRHCRPFHFEAMWLSHPLFMKTVLEKWKGHKGAPEALNILREELRIWNKDVFGNLNYKKDKLLKRIDGIDRTIALGAPIRLFRLQSNLKAEFEEVLRQEEVFWFQKSKEKWVELGDRNTSFFHTSTIVRHHRKHVTALKDQAKNWVVDKEALENMVVGLFKELYTLLGDVRMVRLPRGGFPTIPNEDLLQLDEPSSDDEIRIAFNRMGPYKALGIDGFQLIFYHRCWGGINDSVCAFIHEFFMMCCLTIETNETIIHLIGKVDTPEVVSQFRPISLCNVLYKAITKILSNRLQPIMGKVVSPMQNSFIPGCMITDNIVLA
ncbi:LOW QUALITY PROTEIN: hypothetical protein V2J09_006234 [Rumex salicifolius]